MGDLGHSRSVSPRRPCFVFLFLSIFSQILFIIVKCIYCIIAPFPGGFVLLH